MGMHENPCTGYVVEVSTLMDHFINVEDRHTFAELIENGDYDEAVAMLDKAMPKDMACPYSIFVLNDEDTGGEDLEIGVPYACFDEEDLYEKKEKPELVSLKETIGDVPHLHSWSIWG